MIIPDMQKRAGSHSLWKYIQNGNTGVVRVLLEGGVDPNQLNPFDEPPLVSAIKEEDEKMTALLLSYGASACWSSEYGWTPLMFAEYYRLDAISEMIRACLEKEGVDRKDCLAGIDHARFIGAVYRGEETLVLEYLAAGVDANVSDPYGATAIVLSMKKNHDQFVPLLVDAGADISSTNPYDGMTPLLYAAMVNKLPLVDYLLHKGASLREKNLEGENALTLGIINHNHELVFHLLKLGANPDESIGKSCCTPLMHAAYAGNIDAAKMLVRFGADVTRKDNGGMTALHYAAAHPKSHSIVRLLYEEGAKLEVCADGFTPFMWCVLNENFSVADTLLQCGAKLNPPVEEADFRSFLSFLCNLGDKEVSKVDYLLKRGAQFTEVDLYEAKKPLSCRRQKAPDSDEQINELLKRYGY